jgi:hypothetical protein
VIRRLPFRPAGLAAALAAILTCLCLALPGAERSRAATPVRPVSLELVLAVDISASVDAGEYRLQMQGLAQAFRTPEIVRAILQHGQGVAVSLVQWSDRAQSALDPPWRLLDSTDSVMGLADEIERAGRLDVGHYTAIGNAIDFAAREIEGNAFHGRMRKIDVSGDGQNNLGAPARDARDRALSKGMTINGLAILTDEPRLFEIYRKQVVGGPAAFVMTAASYDDFADAIARKLLRELTIRVSSAR